MFLWSLGNQYNVRILSWFSLAMTPKYRALLQPLSIDNHPLTQRSLQFIGISANKLTFKSINIHVIQSSNNYNIVSGFICWNQNIVYKKILDTSYKKYIHHRKESDEHLHQDMGNLLF